MHSEKCISRIIATKRHLSNHRPSDNPFLLVLRKWPILPFARGIDDGKKALHMKQFCIVIDRIVLL